MTDERKRVEHPVPGEPFWVYEAITNGETVVVTLRHVAYDTPSGTIVAGSTREAMHSVRVAIPEITARYPDIRAENARLAAMQ